MDGKVGISGIPREAENVAVRPFSDPATKETRSSLGAMDRGGKTRTSIRRRKRELKKRAGGGADRLQPRRARSHDSILSSARRVNHASNPQTELNFPNRWIPSQLLQGSPGAIAAVLSRESLDILRQIPFYELVREASGHSSQVTQDVRWLYEALSWRLCSYIFRNQNHMEKLKEVKESLKERRADPFVLDAIENTCCFLDDKRPAEQSIDTLSRLFIRPLKQALRGPKWIRSLQLRALAIQFRRLYSHRNVKWNLQPRSSYCKVSQIDIFVV